MPVNSYSGRPRSGEAYRKYPRGVSSGIGGEVGPAGLGISGSRLSRPQTQGAEQPTYGLAPEQVNFLRQQAATAPAMQQMPAARPAGPQPEAYGGVNGYNTPNMNTRLGPGGRVMAGAPSDYSANGVDTLIGQRQIYNQTRGMSQSDANNLRLGGARPQVIPQMAPAPQPLSGVNSDGQQRLYLPQQGTNDTTIAGSRFVEGQRTPFGSRVVRNPLTGGLALFGEGHDAGPSPSAIGIRGMQAQGAANETARAAERAAAPGGSLQMQNRMAERARMAQRGANMQAMARGGTARPAGSPKAQDTAALTALRHQALQAHLQTLSPQEQMDYLDELLASSGSARPGSKKGKGKTTSTAGPMLDSIGAAIGMDNTPGKPLYPGRFGGY